MKTHIITSDLEIEKSRCGRQGNLLYTELTSELTCKNCRKYLTKFKPWKQDYIMNGFYIEDDKEHEGYPFSIIVR